MNPALHIIPTGLLADYVSGLDASVEACFSNLRDSELSTDAFSFYNSVSAVYSSKIEGENVELDAFIQRKRAGQLFEPDHTRKIDDLYDAYVFAEQTTLSATAVIKAHAILTRNSLPDAQQVEFRTGTMRIYGSGGRLEYEAILPELIAPEMEKFFSDMNALLKAGLRFAEVLYFASMLHLVFVKIHPFDDGNGRTARLLEKWFIAQKLGPKAWLIQSERACYEQRRAYYDNIRNPGLRYDVLDYTEAAPFLRMLPAAIIARTNP